MKILKSLTLGLALLTMSQPALADDKSTVQAFYDFLSNPASEEHVTAFNAVVAEDWESIGDYSGHTKSRAELIGQIGGFGKLIPDLDWSVEEMLLGDGRVVVRGRATGTPVGPLFGVDGKGKQFEILSIDIHTVEDGKIIRTYHVEDWAGALRQLSAK
ncbi:polyketide cyclase (plasmid) [Parasedimentitalea marina]|uniref:Polyketide cyclase n=1 Tax=Parasedimentitalea marina TaxID=2483033 RepID=A0A3T0NA46_9RHOB|nr:ester cyclase [Parasedimentitalea marina]AZV80898.1 polyketide cyclase [Parasedimentitalea marina]